MQWTLFQFNLTNNYWPIDLNNGLNQWLHTYCDVLCHSKSNCKLICFPLYDLNKFSLINESEAQLAPYCYDALWSRHNHQMVMKCTWTWWPVSTESVLCFSKSNVASDHTLRHKSKFLTLLHLCVFIARVWTAEITACIASLFSTCCHFAGKQSAECKGR